MERTQQQQERPVFTKEIYKDIFSDNRNITIFNHSIHNTKR